MFNRDRGALRRRQPGHVGGHRRASGARRRSRGCSRALGETPRVLDLGAGTLDGALEIARRVAGRARRRRRLRARDAARGRARSCRAGAAIATHAADGHHLPYRDAAFDGAFSAFCVRNLADLPRGAARAAPRGPAGRARRDPRVLPPREAALLLRSRSTTRHVLPLVGWAVTGDRDAYRYLPDSIGRFRSPAELRGAAARGRLRARSRRRRCSRRASPRMVVAS